MQFNISDEFLEGMEGYYVECHHFSGGQNEWDVLGRSLSCNFLRLIFGEAEEEFNDNLCRRNTESANTHSHCD